MKGLSIFLFCLAAIQFNCFKMMAAQADSEKVTLSDIVRGEYAPKGLDKMNPLPDGEHYSVLSADGKQILQYSYKTGKQDAVLFDADKVRNTQLERIDGYEISSTGFHIVVWTKTEPIYRRSWKADIYDYDLRRNYLKPLSENQGKLMIPTFSPDGRMCAFVRDNNIWIRKFDYDTEVQVTEDGAFGKIINGATDWVYEEEFSVTNLMSWSSDSRFLAFVKFDESKVPTYSFQVYNGDLYPKTYSYKYPKAGEINSTVSCNIYNVQYKTIKKMDIPLDADGYIPLIEFTKSPDQLAVMTLNREQNDFKMYYVSPKTIVAKMILEEKNKYYVDSDLLRYITFTDDHFVYVSEKDGYRHIYLYTNTGVLVRKMTTGDWDITDFYGIDPATNSVYYQAAGESPLRREIYVSNMKGRQIKLSEKTGTNSASFSTGFKYFIHTYSNANTPNIITLDDEKGKALYTLESNETLQTRISSSDLSSKEFFTFTTPEGTLLNGWILKPHDFDTSKKYPVLMVQYSGPDSQQVLDTYGIDWYYYLANQGYVVACVDGRGTGARGEEFRKSTYLNLFRLETKDQVYAAGYLAKLPYVDGSRIGIWGWSYGGSMTLMAMSEGTGVFKAGVSIAPVTSYRYYDTVYSERYMRTPNENAKGYDYCPLKLADKLSGKLLLVHGTSDDNVHFQNSLSYVAALVKAGKTIDMQVYPDKNHSLLGYDTRMNLYTRILVFLNETLK